MIPSDKEKDGKKDSNETYSTGRESSDTPTREKLEEELDTYLNSSEKPEEEK